MSGGTEVSGGTTLLFAVVFLSELAMLAGLAIIGATMGKGKVASTALGIALPLLVAVAWGVLLAPTSVVGLADAVQIGGKVGLLVGTAVGLVAIGHLVPGLTLGLIGVGSTVTACLLTGSN